VCPQLLFSYYNIDNRSGNKLGNQSFFGSLSQVYNPNDLTSFQNKFALPKQGVAGTYFNVQDTSTTYCSTSTDNCLEANLDVQYLMAISQITPTYYDYYDDNSNNNVFWAAWIATIEDMPYPPYVISISYGSGEPSSSSFSQFDSSALSLSARGVTLIAASGDTGAHGSSSCSYSPSFPATSQYVTAVGATMGPESGSSEIACSCTSGSVITSGGGFSKVEALPSWQSSAVSNYFSTVSTQPVSGYNSNGRGYPDVSLMGNLYAIYVNGVLSGVSGTSASAPAFAGMVALVNAARLANNNATLGWINPSLYKYYQSFILNDITSGNNLSGQKSGSSCNTCSQGFYTATGWDPVTGLGSINFENFYKTFTGETLSNVTFPTSAPASAPTSISNGGSANVSNNKKSIVIILIGCFVTTAITLFNTL
jgi:tripeptidyl-peptidase-1